MIPEPASDLRVILETWKPLNAACRYHCRAPHHAAGLARMGVMHLRGELANIDMPIAAFRAP